MKPDVRYARNGGVAIAYQVVGDGPRDVLLVSGFLSNIEYAWMYPSMASFLTRLAGFARLIVMDRRGSGLSDRVAESPTMETSIQDIEAVLDCADEMESFIAGHAGDRARTDRRLATVLFTDIIGSSEQLVAIGDAAWQERLANHEAVLQRQVAEWSGRFVASTGDGMLATFDGPAAAVRCARSVIEELRPLGLEVPAGAHTGEVEMQGGNLAGIAVHTGARVAAVAGPGEVVVSSVVRDLTAGSGLVFDDAGEHHLKGIPETWRLFRARDTAPG